jgi:hypothetical protein
MEKRDVICRTKKQKPINYRVEKQKIIKQEASTASWNRISRMNNGRIVKRELIEANLPYLRCGSKLVIALSTMGLLLMAGCLKAFC